MGKPTGFLDHERKTASRDDAGDRLKHYREFYNWLPEKELREQASRCMDCGVPFCHGTGCPLGNSIPEFNDFVYNGQWKEAIACLHATNNLPEITGRLCPALCEASCVCALNGKAVSIREIELAVVEKGFAEGWIKPCPPEAETGKKIAVVGSGPAGLAVAQQLRRAGHAVTVFEKNKKLGGTLRYGIPDFKLEKTIIDRRVAQMEAEGIVFKTGCEAGKDISADDLKKQFDAVCLTGGAMQARDLPIPGRDQKGVYLAMQFLTQSNRRVSGEAIEGEEILATGKNVVVIGGGDTGSDCVGTSLRQGAKNVTQIELLPCPSEDRGANNPWPQWPLILRTSSSHEEGGSRDWCISTTEFVGENGQVKKIKCVKVDWVKGDDGRMKMTPVAGSEFELDADLVLLAMGFVQPVHEGLLDGLKLEYDARGNVKVDENMMSSQKGVFAAGDMQTGAWLIVGAIAAGRRLANRVDKFLMGQTCLPNCELPAKLDI